MRYAFLNNEKGCQKKKETWSGIVGHSSNGTVPQRCFTKQQRFVTLGTAAVHMLAVGPSDAATTGAGTRYRNISTVELRNNSMPQHVGVVSSAVSRY